MTDRRDRFADRLLDRDLAEVIGGDGPSSGSRQRLVARMRAAQTRTKTPGAARRSSRPGARRARPTPWIGIASTAAALLVVAVVARVILTGDSTPPPPGDDGAPVVVDNVYHPADAVGSNQPQPQPEPPREVVATVERGGQFARVRADESAQWKPLTDGNVFADAHLQSPEPLDLRLPDGTRLRLDGELRFDRGYPRLHGVTDLYIDSLGSRTALTISGDAGPLDVTDSEVLVRQRETSTVVCCYAGNVVAEEGRIPAGHSAGVAKSVVLWVEELTDDERHPPLLSDLPPRELVAFDFDDQPDGAARATGDNGVVDCPLADELRCVVVPGAELHLRFRATGTGSRLAIYLQVLGSRAGEQWGQWIPLADDDRGSWLEWRIPLDDLADDSDGSNGNGPPPPRGQLLTSLKVFIQHDATAELVLDRLALVRVRPD